MVAMIDRWLPQVPRIRRSPPRPACSSDSPFANISPAPCMREGSVALAVTVAPRQLALALAFADSFAREDFFAGPPNAAALAIDRALARLAVTARWCWSGRKDRARAIWRRSGRRIRAARDSSPRRALALADIPAHLATGALVRRICGRVRFDERAVSIC